MISYSLKLIVALIVVSSILYCFFSLYCTWSFFRRRGHRNEEYEPPVTILKPLNGVENGLYENLLSHINQDYPRYQIIFGVNNTEDPVIPVVERLKMEFPGKDIQFVVSGKTIGSNLKVSNLNNMYEEARYDIILINDSDTWVEPDYLRRVVSPMKAPEVGGSTCLYRVKSTTSFGSAVEAFFINADFFPSALVAHRLGMNFGFGATIVIKRKVLEQIGGFSSLADYLADDYEIGNRVINAGYKLHLSDYIVDVTLQETSFLEYMRHNLRWAKTIKSCRPRGYFLRLFTRGTPFSIAFLVMTGFSTLGWGLFLCHLFARYTTSLIIESVYLRVRSSLVHFSLLPVKDLITFGIWCCGFTGNKITWGRNTFYLLEGGRMVKAGSAPGD